jgi:hypothetical protein
MYECICLYPIYKVAAAATWEMGERERGKKIILFFVCFIKFMVIVQN